MRAVVQRVSKGEVSIQGEDRVRSIGKGYVILLGVEAADGPEDVDWLVAKISKMRLFPDQQGKMNLAIGEVEGEVLVISQFTLHASVKKGNRPSFIRAASPKQAETLYEAFLAKIELALRKPVERGEFGREMQVTIVNDGPVTIWIDTQAKE